MKKSQLKQLIQEVAKERDASTAQAGLEALVGKTIASASFDETNGIYLTFADGEHWLIKPKIGWLQTEKL